MKMTPLTEAVLNLPQVDETKPTPPNACAHIDCAAPPKFQPVLELYAVQRRGGSITRWSKPATATLDMGICDAHAKHATAEDFITDAGWVELTAKFSAAGLVPPSRHLTKLKLAEIILDRTKEG